MAKRYVLGPDAARALKRLLRGSGEISRRQGAAATLAFDSEYVAPFTVQWAQSANDGEGSWIIWLPGDLECLIVDGSGIDVAGSLDAVGGDYPAGWYLLGDDVFGDDAFDNGAAILYLAISGGVAEFTTDREDAAGATIVPICKMFWDVDTGEKSVLQWVRSSLIFGRGGNAKPWDIETEIDDDSGLPQSVMRRCLVTNTNPPTDLGDWRDFPEIADGETYTVYLRMTLPKKQRIDSEPATEYDVVAIQDGTDPGEDEDGLAVLYPLYRLGPGGRVLVDYRDAFVRTFNFWTDERSISQNGYPDFQQVLSLRHFYSDDGDVDSQTVEGAGSCDIIIRAKMGSETRPRVYYVSLAELKKLVRGSAGGTTIINNNPPGGGDDDDDNDDIWIDWNGNCVTALNQMHGRVAVIGGKGINVIRAGNSLMISYDADKDSEDPNPYPNAGEEDVCDHDGGKGGAVGDENLSGGGGGGGVNSEEAGGSGGGGASGSCCGGSSTVSTAGGSPGAGSSGKQSQGGSNGGSSGKPATPSGPTGKSGSGLYNGSTIPRQSIEDTQSRSHDKLTDGTKMNTSPWGDTGKIGKNATTPIYGNTHGQLTDGKTINESPFKSATH